MVGGSGAGGVLEASGEGDGYRAQSTVSMACRSYECLYVVTYVHRYPEARQRERHVKLSRERDMCC